MVRACHELLTADESRNAKPGDLWCSTPRKADKRRPRGSLRALTHAERSTLAHRLARVLDAPAGKMRVAIDAAVDNGKGIRATRMPDPRPYASSYLQYRVVDRGAAGRGRGGAGCTPRGGRAKV